MTDLEMTKACAEAMGIGVEDSFGKLAAYAKCDGHLVQEIYDPLHDDAQAMALVKRLKLTIAREHHGDRWGVGKPWPETMNTDLNRAIVECVAKMTPPPNASK